jgi:hypothetical protein
MSERRCKEWHDLKATILDLSVVQSIDPKQVQQIMREDYSFNATVIEYKRMVQLWNTEECRRRHQALSRGSKSRGSTSESMKSTSSMNLKGKLAAFGVGKYLTQKWEILTSSDSDEDEEEAQDTSSSESSSPRVRDMWADYQDGRRISFGDSETVDDPEPAPYAPETTSNQATTSRHRRQSSLQQTNAAQTEISLVDTSAITEDEAAQAHIAAITDATTPSPTRSDNPPPYSADGWGWLSPPPSP